MMLNFFLQVLLVSQAGQKILDCCAGVGDFTVAGLSMGRSVAAFEQNKVQYGLLKDRVSTKWRSTVLEPFLGPVSLPSCLVDIKLTDHHDVQKGKISADEAKYFINEMMLRPNPPDTGLETWKALGGAAPAAIIGYAKDLEACWTTCKVYRVSKCMFC